jgi:ribonuclease HII
MLQEKAGHGMTTKAERIAQKKQHFSEMMSFDAQYRKDFRYIAGVDEVGRGPLAGPVVTAAVVLPEDFDVFEINDSKKLTDKKRRELDVLIRGKAMAYGFGQRDNRRIDEINILNATKEAMGDAVRNAAEMLRERLSGGAAADGQAGQPSEAMQEQAARQESMDLPGNPDALAAMEEAADRRTEAENAAAFSPISLVMIDAVHLTELEEAGIHQISPTKGDFKSASIAAASIIAKVRRDDMMIDYSEQYPGYAFEKNKGYGTKAHYEGLREYGLTPIHRKSFLKNFL